MDIPVDFKGTAIPLTLADIEAEAANLNCTIAIIHAFSDIESAGSGFNSDGTPKILFEARYFHLLTNGKYDRIAPNISSPIWDRSLYGASGAHQYDRLHLAMSLDREAALQSCSIGRYQIMGANHTMVGYKSIDDMWADFCASEVHHLDAFGVFCTNAGLLPALQSNPPNFVKLAIGYNGSGEAANGYDQKLETAYHHYVNAGEGIIPALSGIPAKADQPMLPPIVQPLPQYRTLHIGMVGDDIKKLQQKLGIDIDGVFGQNTKKEVEKFQQANSLDIDGVAGPNTLKALGLM